MSATLEIDITPSFWRKRPREEDTSPSHMVHMDRKRLRYYYKLESESSKASEEDTESVYSLQGKETDVVRDSSDTDDTLDLDISEYEVQSLSEDDLWEDNSNSSSGTENMTLGHLVAAAQAMYDSSVEKWITDCEESDNSSMTDSSISHSDFSICAQCKSLNVNPQYRYCEKCYQSCRQCKMRKTYKGFPLCISCHKDRKKFFPPRPRGTKKSRNVKKKNELPVKIENLKTALSSLSQDSGIGSSQETTSSSTLPSSDDVFSPEELQIKSGTSDMTSSSSKMSSRSSRKPSTDSKSENAGSFSSTDLSFTKNSRKRYISESSLSDFEIKKPKLREKSPEVTSEVSTNLTKNDSQVDKEKLPKEEGEDGTKRQGADSTTATNTPSTKDTTTMGKSSAQNEKENTELCIICNNAPKDSIFLHTNMAHQCCCYRCAKRTLYTTKRCPICNRSVNKVVKLYTS